MQRTHAIRELAMKTNERWIHPGPQPNGLQPEEDGIWVIDQSDNHLYKLSYPDGSIIEKLDTDTMHSSGVPKAEGHIWVASTYTCELFKLNYDGTTAAHYDTLGKGIAEFSNSPGAPVTGTHGMEWVDNENLWVTVPPAQAVFLLDSTEQICT